MIAHRRRSALIQVLFLTTLLAAFLLILSSEARRSWTVVQDQRREQVARVELGQAQRNDAVSGKERGRGGKDAGGRRPLRAVGTPGKQQNGTPKRGSMAIFES